MFEDRVKFIGNCDNCDKRLRAFYKNVGSLEYPQVGWVPQTHDLSDCIKELRVRIEALEEK